MVTAKIELMKGDITERNTEAIINTANNMLILGSGLGGAIKAKGGIKIAEECALHKTVKIGDAVLTGAGKLKAKHIIHAVLMEFDGQITQETLTKSLLNSLRLAKKHRLKSIAIPDMSMGIVRLHPEECANVIFTVLKEFLQKENKYLRLVEIVLWDIETLRIFKSVYQTVFKEG